MLQQGHKINNHSTSHAQWSLSCARTKTHGTKHHYALVMHRPCEVVFGRKRVGRITSTNFAPNKYKLTQITRSCDRTNTWSANLFRTRMFEGAFRHIHVISAVNDSQSAIRAFTAIHTSITEEQTFRWGSTRSLSLDCNHTQAQQAHTFATK